MKNSRLEEIVGEIASFEEKKQIKIPHTKEYVLDALLGAGAGIFSYWYLPEFVHDVGILGMVIGFASVQYIPFYRKFTDKDYNSKKAASYGRKLRIASFGLGLLLTKYLD